MRRPRVAIARTMQTAGRTVVFSAITVMISLLALLIFPFAYLRSFAYAGVAVVGLAAVAAVVVLPAVLAILGPRVEKGRLFKRRVASDEGGGFWQHQAGTGDAAPVAVSHRRERAAAPARGPVPAHPARPDRRPRRAARRGEQPCRRRPDPRALLEPGERRAAPVRSPAPIPTTDVGRHRRLRQEAPRPARRRARRRRHPASTSRTAATVPAIPSLRAHDAVLQRRRAARHLDQRRARHRADLPGG